MGELLDSRGAPLVDSFGRAITYLRVSVTDRCDFFLLPVLAMSAVNGPWPAASSTGFSAPGDGPLPCTC